ncbi:MAG TPA: hypothetical protein VF029_02140 [Actinomycetota bacterium]
MLDTRLELEPTRVVEPILGWRTWALSGSSGGGDLRLLPIGRHGAPWPPRTPAEADCRRRRAHGEPPAPDCRCGLHATHLPGPLRQARDPAVLGRVALWGRVIEHERGYRARYAYPQRLRLVCPLCLWRSGPAPPQACEVVVRHRGGRMVPFCTADLELSERYGYPIRRRLDAAAVEAELLSGYAVDLLP